MSKRMREAVCVLCGKFGTVTREHVPPQGLFLKPKPTNMITVPCCAPCNDDYKKDDEFFRIYVAMGAEPDTKLYRLWKEKVLGNTLRNSLALQFVLAKGQREFVEQNKGRTVRASDGRLIPPDLHHLAMPLSSSRITRIVTKIVRCLHFHEHGKRLPRDAEFSLHTIFWTEDDYDIVKNAPTGRVGHEGEFLYRYMSIEPGVDRWLLSFYDKNVFDVLVGIPADSSP